jgi:amidase
MGLGGALSAGFENATIAELRQALAAGTVTAAALARACCARIAAYDGALGAVRALDPAALALADQVGTERIAPADRRPLAGIPILVKDNIAAADGPPTTAGSLALAEARARHDSSLVARLREAGAVILGKTNMTEFANMMAIDMPSGYSSLGGQVRNPYAPEIDERGTPIVSPGGSSSGSAVAVAAGFAVAAIGTETSGSLLSPACQNGLVTVKPTVGLISRAGIIPIAASQDTAGPLTRSVEDAAILLDALAAPDPLDPATQQLRRPETYMSALDKEGLKGARIGIPSDPADPGNDVYYGPLSPSAAALMEQAIAVLAAAGAAILRVNLPTAGWIGGPGTEMAILNHNPESPTCHRPARRSIVLVYELKHGLDAYLRDWATATEMKSLADIVAFNQAQEARALRFGQDLLAAAAATLGDLSEIEYRAARAMDLYSARTMGLDAYLDRHRLDAVLFPGAAGAAIAAKAGYPSVQVPAGFIADPDGRQVPFGITFTGRAWSEARLLRLAYAFEQMAKARRPPAGFPPLDGG